MKRILLGLIFSIVATMAFAGGASLPDPLVAPDIVQSDPVCNTSWQCNAPYVDTNGRVPCAIAPDTQIKIISMQAGQSNGEIEGETAVAMSHASSVCNLNYLDGQVYQHGTPALGTSRNSLQGSPPTPPLGYMGDLIADTIIANGSAAQVIEVPMNIGGSRVDQWSDGPLRTIPCIAMQRLKMLGITPQTPNTYFIFRWTQGESDRQGPTQVGTTTADYTSRLSKIFAQLDACGFLGRKFIDIDTWSGNDTWPPVATAQANMPNSVTVFPGAYLDSIPNSCRIDNTHLNSACGIPQGASMFMIQLHGSGYPF